MDANARRALILTPWLIAVGACAASSGPAPATDSQRDAGAAPSEGDADSLGEAGSSRGCARDADCPRGSACVASVTGEVGSKTCVQLVVDSGAPVARDARPPPEVDSGAPDTAGVISDDAEAPMDTGSAPDAAGSACGASCPALTVSFDWGSHGSGPCTATIPATDPAGVCEQWIYTNTTDADVGGFFAQCVAGAWVISDEKCAPRGASMTCFPPGTRCDGSGPAVFPYEHCWTCCNATSPVPGVCN